MVTATTRPKGKSFDAFKHEMLEAYPGVRAKFEELELARQFVARMRRDLVAARRRQGLRQSDVAAALGVSQPVISRIEGDRAGDIGLATIYRYAVACGQVPLVTFVSDPSREVAATAETDEDQAAAGF